MKRLAFAALVLGLPVLGLSPVRADHQHSCGHNHNHGHQCAEKECWLKEKAGNARERFRHEWREYWDTYREGHYWPEPYTTQARSNIMGMFDTQTINGWAANNTLGAHYFDSGTHELNEAGRLHVKWILFQAPERGRVIFIHDTDDPAEVRERIASVQSFVEKQTGQADAVPLAVTKRAPWISPGMDVDVTARLYYSSFPLPRLPGTEVGSSGAAAPTGLPGTP
jgi:hypothetical protein